MNNQNHLEYLIKLFSRLPSLGPRSARRIVLHLVNNQNNLMNPLIEAMDLVIKNIKHCKSCGNLDSNDICSICTDSKRDDSLICVVEEIADLWAIEKSAVFRGKYHVLGGVLSAINGKGPEDLNLNNLLNKVQNQQVNEIILATNPTIDGQTTAYYLAELLKEYNIKISKLANGIPIGSELDYLDEGTLNIAFKSRNDF